ncbi:MAG TPA: molecular chaperone TorD family protein [Acidimicrobiales bacterium]|nr:molecular chaperone TorD family protein [Acidimicrobiales bacterium]
MPHPGALSGVAQRPLSEGSPAEAAGFDEVALVDAIGLLSHWWSRPVVGEVATWAGAAGLEEHLRAQAKAGPEKVLLATIGQDDGLLDEYERLFVGPGPVPCPPYESFWREDVPIDIRRSLMGPCTAELRQLYLELGIEVAPASGELPDHVAIELEALGFALSSEETYPIACSLWSGHLRHWLPRLCRAVARDAEIRFYRELAQLTVEWSTLLDSKLALLAVQAPAQAPDEA